MDHLEKMKRFMRRLYISYMMRPAGLPINATIVELINSLPIGDLHSGYGKELAREIERS